MNKHEKEFIKLIEQHRYQHGVYQVFRDFCSCLACAINSPLENTAENEKRYAEIIKQYDDESETIKLFADLYNLLILAMEDKPFTDVLGSIYMQLNIADKKHLGQCFTPDGVSQLCASLTAKDIGAYIERDGFVAVNDCCVGGGSMVLQFAKRLKSKGYNPQRQLCVICNDIDGLCVDLAYIQLSLNGIPAIVSRGNTLTQEFTQHYRTPMWIIYRFDYKYRRLKNE